MPFVKTSLILAASAITLSACANLPMKGGSNSGQTVYSANSAPGSVTNRMKNSRGLNTEAMLASEIEHSIQELSRVEQSIAAVRAGMLDVIPSLKRLETLHGEVAALNERLRKVMNDIGATNTSMVEQPTPITTPAQTIAPQNNRTAIEAARAMAQAVPETQARPAPATAKPNPQPVATVPSGVTGVRIGVHAGKTRLVIDYTGDVAPRFDLDNNERLMTIELPGLAWNTDTSMSSARNGTLIAGYAADKTDSGSLLAVALTRETQILEQFSLKASAGKPTRLVFDLKN